MYKPYELFKVKKQYNQFSCPILQNKYIKVNTNFVGLIILYKFFGKRYFFTFTNKTIKETETYTRKKKNKWFGYL